MSGVMGFVEDADVKIPDVLRKMFHQVCEEIRQLEGRVQSVEGELKILAKQTPAVEHRISFQQAAMRSS